jgi:hypothetical protein
MCQISRSANNRNILGALQGGVEGPSESTRKPALICATFENLSLNFRHVSKLGI